MDRWWWRGLDLSYGRRHFNSLDQCILNVHMAESLGSRCELGRSLMGLTLNHSVLYSTDMRPIRVCIKYQDGTGTLIVNFINFKRACRSVQLIQLNTDYQFDHGYYTGALVLIYRKRSLLQEDIAIDWAKEGF